MNSPKRHGDSLLISKISQLSPDLAMPGATGRYKPGFATDAHRYFLYPVVAAESPAGITNSNLENYMAVYRITRFAASDMDKVGEKVETMRATVESTGAEFIDLVSYGNGKGVVLAKYADQASIFADMVEAGLIDGDSIHPHMGEVFASF
jgi:hypothetical protein